MNKAVVLWLGAKDGVGTTTCAVTAACIGQGSGHERSVVCDWDAAYHGDAAHHFGSAPARRCDAVASHLPKLRGAPLAGFCQIHPSGIGMLTRPGDVAPSEGGAAETETYRQAQAALAAVRETYDALQIDAGSRIDPLTILVACQATHCVVVCRPEFSVIQATERLLARLHHAHCPRQRILLLCHQWGDGVPWSPTVLQAQWDCAHVASTPMAADDLAAAHHAGIPLAIAQPQHPYVVAIAEAIARFLSATATAPPCRIDGERLLGRSFPAVLAATAPSTACASTTGLRAVCLQQLQQEIDTRKLGASATFAQEVERLALAVIDHLPAEDLADVDRAELLAAVLDDAIGFGPLAPLLRDPTVTEIMVNGCEQVFVERGGRICPTDIIFTDAARLHQLIERVVAPTGRRVDESSPMVDVRLPDGARVNVILPPLALTGPTMTIRRFPQRRLTITDLITSGSLTAVQAATLQQLVRDRRNIIVSGGTGTGKTTLLNILSAAIPPSERIVTIEDAAELQLAQAHVVRLEARPPNLEGRGTVTIRDLVRNALRMRPDRIIVGECRGGEALDMLQAMNTGHDGSLTTIHANSPADCLRRLETLVLFAGMELPLTAIREQIAGAIHYIVQLARRADGRRAVTEITRVEGLEDGKVNVCTMA